MPSKDTYERISIDIVAAARATFAQGRRTEAIEMLRRFDLGRGRAAVAGALQELMAEHQRLSEEERRVVREAVDVHLNAAEALLADGQLAEAWARACDAVHVDPADQRATALEARIRTSLDEQTGRARQPQSAGPAVPPEPEPAPRDREREKVRSAPETSRTDPTPPVSADPRAMRSQSGSWVVAALVVLAILLAGLAARTC